MFFLKLFSWFYSSWITINHVVNGKLIFSSFIKPFAQFYQIKLECILKNFALVFSRLVWSIWSNTVRTRKTWSFSSNLFCFLMIRNRLFTAKRHLSDLCSARVFTTRDRDASWCCTWYHTKLDRRGETPIRGLGQRWHFVSWWWRRSDMWPIWFSCGGMSSGWWQ